MLFVSNKELVGFSVSESICAVLSLSLSRGPPPKNEMFHLNGFSSTKKNSNTYSKVAKPCDIPSTCRISYFLM